MKQNVSDGFYDNKSVWFSYPVVSTWGRLYILYESWIAQSSRKSPVQWVNSKKIYTVDKFIQASYNELVFI